MSLTLTTQPVSVPFARGTPPWLGGFLRERGEYNGFSPLREGDTSVATAISPRDEPEHGFQSPSRGGHLRGQS